MISLRFISLSVNFLLANLLLADLSLNASPAKAIDYNRDVKPILANNCFECHGPSASDQKGDLRLDLPTSSIGSKAPRDGYFIIKEGSPEHSELIHRIESKDPEAQMPPPESHKKPLSPQQIERLKTWVAEGAVYQEHWAFTPPREGKRSPSKDLAWAKNRLDEFVWQRLQEKGLHPSQPASRRTLLRRLSFDLTGLPPTPEEIQRFLQDDRPDAYDHLVDDLLSRGTYGEHMTRYWADLVRLSDTNGMHKDFHREFSTYRDWLIRAFNQNMPFDTFIRYQLAGDLFPNPSRDQLTASGFNRLHMIIDRGTALPEESLHKNVVDRVQAFGTVFLGLTVQCAQCHDHKYDPITQRDYYQLYAFFNNFDGAPETNGRPTRGLQPPFLNLTNAKQAAVLRQLDEQEKRLQSQQEEHQLALRKNAFWPAEFQKVESSWLWSANDVPEEAAKITKTLTLETVPQSAILRIVTRKQLTLRINETVVVNALQPNQPLAIDLTGILQQGDNTLVAQTVIGLSDAKPVDKPEDVGFSFVLDYLVDQEKQTLLADETWMAVSADGSVNAARLLKDKSHNSEWTKQARTSEAYDFDRQLASVRRERSQFLQNVPAAMYMAERAPMRETTLLEGGAYDAPGEPVERNTPAFLPPLRKQSSQPTRMDLANWLIREEHPLTARVVVNRLWQQFFGTGLVKTSEDFGAQGELPSHPELLDDLAVRFRQSGWNTKRLIREIVTSATYRQSSDAPRSAFEADPENRFLARGARFRLDAEVIRDQILMVSGQLNPTMYGQSVKPPQPPGLWEMVSMASPFRYVADQGEKIVRRSLYTYWRRGIPPPQMTILNAPSREYCVTRRERTNTPLQALLLMNEEEYYRAAQATAEIVIHQHQGNDQRIILSSLYERITSQRPTDSQLNYLAETLATFRDHYQSRPDLTTAYPSEALPDKHSSSELAAWTLLAHSLLNLEMTKVKR